jgi:hypothetical protein
MASGDVDELERGGLLARDEDGKLETLASSTTTVTDADVQHSGCPPWRQRADSLWEPVPPASAAPKSVQFAVPQESEPEPELEADAVADAQPEPEPEPEDSGRGDALVRGTTLSVDEYEGGEERASPEQGPYPVPSQEKLADLISALSACVSACLSVSSTGSNCLTPGCALCAQALCTTVQAHGSRSS